jgi:hypothetical protein
MVADRFYREGSRTPIRERIQRLKKGFAVMYGHEPSGLFIPAGLAFEFIAAMDDLDAVNRDPAQHEIEGGLVLDTYDGMRIKLVTGNKLGVGTVRIPDETTPLHNAVYEGDPSSEH